MEHLSVDHGSLSIYLNWGTAGTSKPPPCLGNTTTANSQRMPKLPLAFPVISLRSGFSVPPVLLSASSFHSAHRPHVWYPIRWAWLCIELTSLLSPAQPNSLLTTSVAETFLHFDTRVSLCLCFLCSGGRGLAGFQELTAGLTMVGFRHKPPSGAGILRLYPVG